MLSVKKKHEGNVLGIHKGMADQHGLGVEKEQDSPGGPPAKPASGQPEQAQACHQESNEIGKVPDVRREHIRKCLLDKPDNQGTQRNKSRTVAFVGRIQLGLVACAE